MIRFDWAIKRLLRNKASYTVLEGFLSVLLKESIKIVNIKESEGNKTHADDKFNRVDILVEDSLGELFIVEIQNSFEVDYLLRMLYGVSKAVVEHIYSGMRYGTIRKIYHISILYFRMGDGKDYVYRGGVDFRGIHRNNRLKLTEEERRFFKKDYPAEVLPEYYILCVNDFDNISKSSLDEWIYYLKNTEILDTFTAPGLKEVKEQLQYDRLSPEEKIAYDHHLKQILYEQNVVEDSYAKGRAEALAENEQTITELTQDLAQKDQDLAQKDKNLAQKDQEIEALLKQLAELKKQTQT